MLTAASVGLHLPVRTVADLGRLPDALPLFASPPVPLDLDTPRIVAGPALAIAAVVLLESLMTAGVVDDLTGPPSSRDRECAGLGIANMASSLFGGIAGCGMVGQTVSNVKYGGRGRLSTLFADVFLPVLTVLLKPWVCRVPVAAVIVTMSSAAMLATVAVTVATGNLALGVGVGVLLSGVFFASKVAGLLHVAAERGEAAGRPTYRVSGQLFFASADAFVAALDTAAAAGLAVVIDVARAHVWDVTAVAALDEVAARFRQGGAAIEVVGLNAASATLIARLDERAAPGGA